MDDSADVSDLQVLFFCDGCGSGVEVHIRNSGFQYRDAALSCGVARGGLSLSEPKVSGGYISAVEDDQLIA